MSALYGGEMSEQEQYARREAAALLVSVSSGNGFDTEPYACFGVDIQSMGGAPGGERVRIYVDSLEGLPLTSKMIDEALRLAEPVLIVFRKLGLVCEYLQEPPVVLGPIPGDAYD